jgi:xanthine dehydrogenase accessory factor
MISPLFQSIRVSIRGGGDLGSGVAYRLFVSGFPVLITELAHPLLVRRAVSFGSAVIERSITVEGITAHHAGSFDEALAIQQSGEIPVMIDPDGESLPNYQPVVLIDARMLKTEPGGQPVRPTLMIGLGPGYEAPVNCDVVLETNRGHRMGRVITSGKPEDNTGMPEGVLGHRADRVLRAPAAGDFRAVASIGTAVHEGTVVAQVGEQLIAAPFEGVLRGLIHDGIHVRYGDKVGDIDPRGEAQNCVTISDKALAVGGGALEAILSSPVIRPLLEESRAAVRRA